ncbi:MAG: TIR domain-containing protein [Acidobacteriota bacterium]|nr:TIR domain-containing protein [Acidobacteriota bacterium]
MAQIFFSYKSSDENRIRPLVQLLEDQGWSVWWDHQIPPGKTFDEVIEKEIKEAACLVVVWSRDSVHSSWVKTEAAEGAKRDILVPVLIDDVEPPFEFRRVQAAKLLQLDAATADDPELRNLLASVAKILEEADRREQGQPAIPTPTPIARERPEEGEAVATGAPSVERPVPPPPRRVGVYATAGLGVLLVALCYGGYRFLAGEARQPQLQPPTGGQMSFIGVDAGPDYAAADRKLADYLREEVASTPPLTFSQDLYSYESVVDKLADWKRKDGPFLARTTPYVYVAAEMLGAELEVLATYQSRATHAATYRSYFVVQRAAFPHGPPTLEDLVPFLRETRRTFIYHDRFSTSSYFLPSLFFREHKIFHMDRSSGPLIAIAARQIPERSSTELVREVGRGTADLAAVWDGTKVKFEQGDPADAELAAKVYFIAIDTPLPNDLLVCSSFLASELKEEIRRVIRAMAERGRASPAGGPWPIDIDDFLWWDDLAQATAARGALAELRQRSAPGPPAPVTVDVQQADTAGGLVPDSYLEAARQAIERSGSEFVVYDPEYHQRADFIWRLSRAHDGAILLTSRIKGLSEDEGTGRADSVQPQEQLISFADEAELAGRIGAFIQSRIHRLRYLWPYETQRPTLIRDVGFGLRPGTQVTAQEIAWKDPDRNLVEQGADFDATVAAFDAHKITLKTEDFSLATGGFEPDPLSNRSYRVVLARDDRRSVTLVALSYLFTALLVVAAAAAVMELRRSRRKRSAGTPSALRLIAPESPPAPVRLAKAG